MRDDPDIPAPDNGPLKFGRLSVTTGFLVRRLHNLLSVSWQKSTQPAAGGVTAVQAGLLVLISENPGVSQSRLLKALEVESATLVRSTSRLVELGLIEKTRSARDRRVYYLHLTQSGREMLDMTERAMEARERRLTEDIPPDDLQTFHRVARQLIAKRSSGARSGMLDGLLLTGSEDE
jgi:DNA-binding MarR family transcriptional regulator